MPFFLQPESQASLFCLSLVSCSAQAANCVAPSLKHSQLYPLICAAGRIHWPRPIQLAVLRCDGKTKVSPPRWCYRNSVVLCWMAILISHQHQYALLCFPNRMFIGFEVSAHLHTSTWRWKLDLWELHLALLKSHLPTPQVLRWTSGAWRTSVHG